MTNINSPMLLTPLTDVGYFFGGVDIQKTRYQSCRKFELKFMDCMEAYGIQKGYRKCYDYYEDLNECKLNFKKFERFAIMYKEREKQFRSGKVPTQFIEGPPQETFYNVSEEIPGKL